MNTQEKVIQTINSWIGCIQGDSTHRHIVDMYNIFSGSPLNNGRRAKINYTSAWCAATVTAAFYEAGAIEFFPCGECSCGKIIELAKKYGIWQEDDSYHPKKGDAVIYDWNDNGIGDDTTGHDHIGLVTDADDKYFYVTEGNMGNAHKCGTRKLEYNARYIRGFVVPKFKDKEEKTEAYYFVQKGDNLTKIAKLCGVTKKQILELNPSIVNPNLIYPGQKVRVR